ncbi:helix-turn-helix domain-containing protein [Tessaracoccus sp. MC1865]|uniref:helix-turn-helix transcriptional regulator n=1 Tax=Tessaracoccus sp. MC1865 TaxID=2760310 RepID=UPI0016022C84|nr:helix-turn-helix domain-containing protein [Tessaracoccus sp. MC1865]MBB1482509.1 helix-turn-helix domain-containing protein [Tessaracoccus sp. MC1865]QTO38036.1 helix-turn-helix domain-containing protein [Tessaracoccus sp. MC1865]
MDDQLLTTKQVAEMTGGVIKESTIRFWRHIGDRGPRSFSLEGRVVYKRSDVEKWLNEQYEKASA